MRVQKPFSRQFFMLGLSILFLMSLPKGELYAQDFDLREIIKRSKQSILPVMGVDRNWSFGLRAIGTGVVVGNSNMSKALILTCEHVIAIKDSNERTVRKVENVFLNFNLANDSVITLPAKVVYSDEKNDFALLEYSTADYRPKDSAHMVAVLHMPTRMFESGAELQEGDHLVYIGYPMKFGVGNEGEKNYPISRRGIVAQNVPDKTTFLMEGFVQGGNSGSPVFTVRQVKGGGSVIKFAGIAQAYPKDFGGEVYNIINDPNPKLGSKDQSRIVVLNPGFTQVLKTDEVLRVLKEKFGFN